MNAHNKRQFILAPAGSGKSFASKIMPDVIKDVDFGYYKRLAGIDYIDQNSDKAKKLLATYDFQNAQKDWPVNFVRAVADAYETHPVVVTPTYSTASGLVELISEGKGNREQIKNFVEKMLVKFQELFPNYVFDDAKLEELTDSLIVELKRLRQFDIEPVVTVFADQQAIEENVQRIHARPEKGEIGKKPEDWETDVALGLRANELSERLVATGKYSKLIMYSGQTFADAFQQNEIERAITYPDFADGAEI